MTFYCGQVYIYDICIVTKRSSQMTIKLALRKVGIGKKSLARLDSTRIIKSSKKSARPISSKIFRPVRSGDASIYLFSAMGSPFYVIQSEVKGMKGRHFMPSCASGKLRFILIRNCLFMPRCPRLKSKKQVCPFCVILTDI